MSHYLIEFRFQSKRIRTYLSTMIYGINRRFDVGKRKHIPHITLVGPFQASNEKRLLADFSRVCSQTKVMKFKGRGFGTFDSNRVVYVNIGASDRLNEFRIQLVEALKDYCDLLKKDKRKEKDRFGYHSTLAMKLSQEEFDKIKSYIHSQQPPDFTQIVMRITLLKKGKILREYDFMQRRTLNRRQALNKHILRKSKSLVKEFMSGRHDPNRNIEFESIEHTVHKPKTVIQKIYSFFTGK